LFSSVQ